MTHKPNPDSPQERFESQIERAIRIINKGDLLNPITGGLSIARCDEVKQVLTRARERLSELEGENAALRKKVGELEALRIWTIKELELCRDNMTINLLTRMRGGNFNDQP